MESVNEEALVDPFMMQVLSNPNITVANKIGERGIRVGQQAMIAAGAQSEFVAANMIQCHALQCSIVLRAGSPPQYNKHRSPKSGINKTKTSNQGFFKGSLAQNVCFARLSSNGTPQAHDEKDAAHLLLQPSDPDYQHVMQLDINIRDIIREIRSDGDLTVLGFDENTKFLRLAYKDDTNLAANFKGQFVINLSSHEDIPIFYSREWDKPECDREWDVDQGMIKKPAELAALPDEFYKELFNYTFKLEYTDNQEEKPEQSSLKPANVFANRPRSAEEFKYAMGTNHPNYYLINECTTFNEVLSALKKNLGEEDANKLIIDVYNKAGKIVAGDWDGMLLGHPHNLNANYKEVLNVFLPKEQGINNKEKLLTESDNYLKEIQSIASKKLDSKLPLNSFEQKALSIQSMAMIVSDFALARAGCITPYEFVYQQLLNDAYRDTLNRHYGENYDDNAVQKAMEHLVARQGMSTQVDIIDSAKQLLQEQTNSIRMNTNRLNKLAEHMASHYPLAVKSTTPYVLPHLQHDLNIHDLYQHGFDMRNPFGSNLDGPWFLITDEGNAIHGQTQEQLIEVLLTGNFLEKNSIDINPYADMSAGWGRVIEKQILLKQTISAETMLKYDEFKSENIDYKKALNAIKEECPLSSNNNNNYNLN